MIFVLIPAYHAKSVFTRETFSQNRSADALVVNTKYGRVRGFYLNETIRAFYGIPFALPPVGSRRWRRPSDPKPWKPNVFDATKTPNVCMQTKPHHQIPVVISEDCLYLNVYTPANTTPAANLPVIVIFHGGVFKYNSAMTLKTDGRFLAASGAVVVNLNYRLGALGFVVTDSPDINGNYGIMDQRHALKFVQENIQFFGGNPRKVTIMGPSAGAQSVAIHLTSPKSDPLFSQAIVQSNAFTDSFKTDDEMASTVGTVFAEYLNCSPNDVVCLRSRSAEDILDAGIKTEKDVQVSIAAHLTLENYSHLEVWTPVIDGLEVTSDPLEAFEAGKYRPKPLIIGTNKDDQRSFTGILGDGKISMTYYLECILFLFEWKSVQIVEKYPPQPLRDNRDTLGIIMTDYLCGCSSRLVARLIANQSVPIYHYIYSYPSPPDLPGVSPICSGYSCHADDVMPAYGTFSLTGFTPSPSLEFVSESMIYSWLNFAHTGDPSDHTWSKTKKIYANWPRYKSANGWQSYEFTNAGNIVVFEYRKEYCDLWDTLGYIKGTSSDKCLT